MNEEIIRRNNEIVSNNDTVHHLGDFCLANSKIATSFLNRLNGNHIFIKGSHDYWLDNNTPTRLEINIGKQFIVLDHYAMRVWARSHYNSWQLYGHSHGKLPPQGKQWDVGVDNNNFYPISFNEIVKIMEKQPDNFNLIRK